MRFFWWLWSFLPDKCEMRNCRRHGVRGNENIIDGIRVCDYCHAAKMNPPGNLTVCFARMRCERDGSPLPCDNCQLPENFFNDNSKL
jgi:hypothetical protein